MNDIKNIAIDNIIDNILLSADVVFPKNSICDLKQFYN